MKQGTVNPDDNESSENDSSPKRPEPNSHPRQQRGKASGRSRAGAGLIKNTRKDGTESWSYRYYDSAEGKTVWGETFDTADEADAARMKARLASKSGSKRSGKLTVAGFAEDWPESHPEGRVASTLESYKYGVKPFVEEFGPVKLRKLRRSKCKEWARGRKRWMISPANAMLHDMWDDELIPANPLAGIKLPKEPGRDNYPILSTDEIWMLVDIARNELGQVGDQIAGIIITSAFVGTRISETLALGSSVIDYSAGALDVRRQVDGRGLFKPPKGGKTRLIALPPYLKQAWEIVGVDPLADPFFKPKRAPIFLYNNFNRYFRDVAMASGVKGLNVHELRRHCCQWLLHLDVPEWAANYQVGHGTFSSSLRQLYTRPDWKARELVSAAMSKDAVPLTSQGRWAFDPAELA